MRIAIVTDSTADIPADLVRELDIKVIPLAVHFGGKAYLDRVDITNQEFYDYIGTAKTLPTTSQPSPAQYMDVYRACREEGAERVLSIHISSEMSGTWQGAKLAADMVKDEIAVEVVDSHRPWARCCDHRPLHPEPSGCQLGRSDGACARGRRKDTHPVSARYP